MCVTFVTCEVRVCGLRCRSGSSLYIYRVYLLTYYVCTYTLGPRLKARNFRHRFFSPQDGAAQFWL